MKVQNIDLESVLNAEKGDYNRSIWKDTVNRLNGYKNAFFIQRTDRIEYGHYPIYCIYEADGIRFIKEVSFSHCLSNGSFSAFRIVDGEIKRDDSTPKGYGIPDTKSSRSQMAAVTELSKDVFFSKDLSVN